MLDYVGRGRLVRFAANHCLQHLAFMLDGALDKAELAVQMSVALRMGTPLGHRSFTELDGQYRARGN
jgi:hypothetical protein